MLCGQLIFSTFRTSLFQVQILIVITQKALIHQSGTYEIFTEYDNAIWWIWYTFVYGYQQKKNSIWHSSRDFSFEMGSIHICKDNTIYLYAFYDFIFVHSSFAIPRLCLSIFIIKQKISKWIKHFIVWIVHSTYWLN